MRLANHDGRLMVARAGDSFVDVEAASDGRFGSDPQAVYEHWDAFGRWLEAAELPAGEQLVPEALGPPVPRPRQVFAVALNYPEHAAEGGFTAPEQPLIFTKFPTCIAGPVVDVALPGDRVDYEAELVCVIGRRADHVAEPDAWNHVAGLTAGQDLSARDVQMRGPAPQYSLGKSFPGFGPTGPWVVSTDEPGVTGALEVASLLNGEQMQHDTTASMIFSIPVLIAYISAICPLLPGDLIFTGTPSGVGFKRDPPRYLKPGDVLVTRISGIGEITQRLR
jgi:2-keto-4-pentenoate hydratase/2-oxohepta-3-ene-1,7-dioic acid hydratase in catechol pathway